MSPFAQPTKERSNEGISGQELKKAVTNIDDRVVFLFPFPGLISIVFE